MASKPFLALLGVFALVLLIASEVVARDLGETTNTKQKSDETNTKVETDQYGDGYPGGGYQGGGGYPGGGYQGGGGYPGGGYQGGGGYPGGGGYRGGGYGGGYCRFGCCYRGYNGCRRCCSYAEEATEVQVQNEPHN